MAEWNFDFPSVFQRVSPEVHRYRHLTADGLCGRGSAAIATIVVTGSVNAADLAPAYKAACCSGTGRLQLDRVLTGVLDAP
jgi:hypothetical protein